MTESAFSVHSFQHNLCENIVNYQVTTLQGQTMIWIGSGEPCLGNLSAAVPCRDYPSTALLGQSDQSNMLASRLSKKLNKQVRDNCATETVFRTTYFQVFVSYNLPDDQMLTPLVIEKLVAEIKSSPDKF